MLSIVIVSLFKEVITVTVIMLIIHIINSLTFEYPLCSRFYALDTAFYLFLVNNWGLILMMNLKLREIRWLALGHIIGRNSDPHLSKCPVFRSQCRCQFTWLLLTNTESRCPIVICFHFHNLFQIVLYLTDCHCNWQLFLWSLRVLTVVSLVPRAWKEHIVNKWLSLPIT